MFMRRHHRRAPCRSSLMPLPVPDLDPGIFCTGRRMDGATGNGTGGAVLHVMCFYSGETWCITMLYDDMGIIITGFSGGCLDGFLHGYNNYNGGSIKIIRGQIPVRRVL